MGFARVDRVALQVANMEEAVEDLREVFGIELTIFDVEAIDARVALGNDGFELIEPNGPDVPITAAWNPPLVTLSVRVADLEEARRRMEALRIELTHEFLTPAGLTELYYGYPGMHGIPITLSAYDDADPFMANVCGDEAGGKLDTQVVS